MRKTLIALLLLIFPLSANAESVDIQSAINKIIPNAAQVGSGKYYWKGIVHAYDATLYAQQGKYDSQKPFALNLEYKTDIDGDDIADKSIEEMNKVKPIDQETAGRWLKLMMAIFPDVDNGVNLTGVNIPGKGVTFLKDGKKIGEINDVQFAADFFAIWFSPVTRNRQLRAELLGIAK